MLNDCPLPRFPSIFLPDYNHLTYMFSNESDCEKTFSILTGREKLQDKNLHIGFAFWFNLNLVAKQKSNYAIICDIDPGINLLFECLLNAIIMAPNRELFVQLYIEQLRRNNFIANIHYIFNEPTLKTRLDVEQRDPLSWLGTPENFSHVKWLFMERRIICRKLDVKDLVGFRVSLTWLKQKAHVFSVESLYLSNIYEWLQKSGVSDCEHFKINIDLFHQDFPAAVIIDAFYDQDGAAKGMGPPQRVFFASLPEYPKAKARKHAALTPHSERLNKTRIFLFP